MQIFATANGSSESSMYVPVLPPIKDMKICPKPCAALANTPLFNLDINNGSTSIIPPDCNRLHSINWPMADAVSDKKHNSSVVVYQQCKNHMTSTTDHNKQMYLVCLLVARQMKLKYYIDKDG